jgi:hypothetical protein
MVPTDTRRWNNWDSEEFAMYFYRWLKERSHPGVTDLSEVCFGGDAVISYLYNADGSPRRPTQEELE